MVIKAVIFDIGGVVMRSPMLAIAQYEKENNLPPNYINCTIANIGPNGAFQRLERGEISLFPFYKTFSSELSASQGKIWYEQYCKSRDLKCPSLPDDIQIDGRELFGRMMRESAIFDELVVRAIKRLRELNLLDNIATGRYRVIALTNNFSRSRETAAIDAPSACDIEAELEFLGWQEGPVTSQLQELFDDFCDSSTCGLRKPDPTFYLLACKRNQIVPSEAIFLDDIGYNLKTAKDLGMKTIRTPPDFGHYAIQKLIKFTRAEVKIGKSEQALEELGRLLGLSLTDNQMKAQL